MCASNLDEDDVQLLCMDRGAQYGYLVQSQDIENRFYPPITQNGITNINCSGSYGYFDSYYCSYQVSYDHCNANGGPALITCVSVGKIIHTHLSSFSTFPTPSLLACILCSLPPYILFLLAAFIISLFSLSTCSLKKCTSL